MKLLYYHFDTDFIVLLKKTTELTVVLCTAINLNLFFITLLPEITNKQQFIVKWHILITTVFSD
ncbi:MAG: hypothetical protein LBH80_06300 [Prevotellaceae bacterium]|jgi:hypothetical protein|nr:hypothetical protein [Prevotellaceae bacterium]